MIRWFVMEKGTRWDIFEPTSGLYIEKLANIMGDRVLRYYKRNL